MPIENIYPEGADTTRGPSASIWGRCPFTKLQQGLGGVAFYDDFLSIPITPNTTEGNWSQYAQFSSTGGTITNDTTELGGTIAIASDDDGEAVVIRSVVSPYKIIRTGKRFWAEVRLAVSTITDTKITFFWGLMENTAGTVAVPLVNNSPTALADKNVVGWFHPEGTGNGAVLQTTYKADGVTAVTVQAAAGTLVASTYTKLGMKYEPSGDKDGQFILSFYQDGTRCSTSKQIPSSAGTDFPNDINMGPVIAIQNAAGSSPGSLLIDWWRYAQEI